MESNVKDTLQIVAGIIGFASYIPLVYSILTNKASQSFAAFFLWGILDAIAMFGTLFQHGNFWLPLSNVVGATSIALLLVIKKQVSWSWIESITAMLVVVCMIFWYRAGHTGAIMSSSIALLIASIPQVADTYQRPKETPVLVYFIWLGANILSFLAGKSWTINERFYAGCGIVLCLIIIVMSFVGKGRKIAA